MPDGEGRYLAASATLSVLAHTLSLSPDADLQSVSEERAPDRPVSSQRLWLACGGFGSAPHGKGERGAHWASPAHNAVAVEFDRVCSRSVSTWVVGGGRIAPDEVRRVATEARPGTSECGRLRSVCGGGGGG